MTIASGISKQLRYKVESTWGVAPGTSGAKLLRRVTSNPDLTKATYQSQELRSDYQISDFRHGVRSITGNINGEISPGTYSDFFAAALRAAFVSGATTGAITTVAATIGPVTFTRSTGSYFTDGLKVGDVGRWSGWATTGVANNTRNFLITSLTATVMIGVYLDGTAGGAKIAGDSVTFAVTGKKVLTPQTGHLDLSYALEHWNADIAQSELMLGCKVQQIAIGLPPSGISTANFGFLGKDVTTASSAYYVSPTANTTSGVMAAVNGVVSLNGSTTAAITNMSLTIASGLTAQPVVGSNTYPFIQQGRVNVSGQLTAFFQDASIRDLFINETPAPLVMAFTTDNTATADFMTFNIPKAKYNSATKDDGEKGIELTASFQALLNPSGGTGTSTDLTTLAIQDSLA